MTNKILKVEGLTKKFGKFRAIDEVSYEISEGSLPALIGPNGAGKTTMYDLLTGKLPPTEGEITFQGEGINEKSVSERTQLGLGRTFQITNVFEGLSVRQNIRAPIIVRTGVFQNILLGDVTDETESQTEYILDLLEIEDLAGEEVESLSYGDKRRVEIGVALATDPDLLLLDEPTAGMTPAETQRTVNLIEQLNHETETTFMITEHDMDVVFSTADRILVLDSGQIIADGSPGEIQSNEQVTEAYLGQKHE